MRFREAIQCERADRLYDHILGFSGYAGALHSRAQLYFYLFHPLYRALEPESPPQFFGLAARKTRTGHSNTQQLFLKQWYSQRPL